MKNFFVSISLFFATITVIHAMENNTYVTPIHGTQLLHGTQLRLMMAATYNYSNGEVDYTIVGKNEQWLLEKGEVDRDVPGRIYSYDKKVFIKKNQALQKKEDLREKQEYTPFRFHGVDQRPRDKFRTVLTKGSVLRITEPCVEQEGECWDDEQKTFEKIFSYNAIRFCLRNQKEFVSFEYQGKDAIVEAAKDLKLCYSRALECVMKLKKKETQVNVAFTTLGTEVGFPWENAAHIALSTIFTYLRENQQKTIHYKTIYLLVAKRFEFDLYKKLIEDYLAQ